MSANAGLAQPERSQPYAVLTNASGDLDIWNSRDGQAVFQFSGLAPGRSVSGTVELKNTGGLPGDLGLEQLDVQDQPGVNGGRLSDAVHLDITDITGGSSVPVFAGQVGALASRPLGAIGPGEGRTFQFQASLPDTGPPPSLTGGDNAYAGSGLTMRYAWYATASGSIGPDGNGGNRNGGSRNDGNGGTGGVAPVVKIKVKSKKLLKRGFLDVMTTCSVACRVSAYAQLPKAKKRAKKVPRTRKRTALLNIPNKAARIRLKVSKKAKRQLVKKLKKKRAVVLKVKASVSPASGGAAKTYTRKAKVKRPKRKPRRR